MRAWLVAVAAAVLWCQAAASAARPYTVDDLLHQESLGAVEIDPSGRWLVFERRLPYDTARRYDYDHANSQAQSQLQVVDLRGGIPAHPLLVRDPGPGVVMGPFSPSGQRLAVFRLRDRAWTFGIVTLATGVTRWFDLTPIEATGGRPLQWLSDSELLVVTRPDRRLPRDLRQGGLLAERLPQLWADAARGAGAHTVLGSGRYASVRERSPPNLLLRLDARTGRARRLASGEIIDLEVSPDRRRVALFRAGPDLQVRGNAPVRGPAGFETEATRLTLLDLASGAEASPCPDCDFLPQLLSWSPSGRNLLTLARGPDGLWTSGRLMVLPAAGGGPRPVGHGLRLRADFNPVTVWTAWMGEDPLVVAYSAAGAAARQDWYRLGAEGPVNLSAALPSPDRFVRLTDDHRLSVLAGDEIWRVDRDGGHPERLSRETRLVEHAPRPVDGARLDRAPRPSFWLAVGEGAGALTRLVPDGLQPTLDLPEGEGALVTASATGRAGVWQTVDSQGVTRLWLLEAGHPPGLVATLNAGLADTDTPIVRPVTHSGPEGQPLTSWLFLPRGVGGGRPPLVVRPYLGRAYPRAPRDSPGEPGFLQNLRVLTGHGYAVLVPSLPNPPGGMTEPAANVAGRILDIVDAAARDPELAALFDPDRVGLTGFSFGGFTVMAAITQTHRFRAAVAIAGISDMTAYWASLTPFAYADPQGGYVSNWHTGGVEVTQPRMLGPPWLEPDRYTRNSPLLFADRIETPLLLLHGAMDPIPHAGSEAMYSALFRQGKDAMLVTYWGALHGLTIPGDVRDVYARTFAFFDEHLGVPVIAAGGVRAASPARASASVAPMTRRPRRPRGRSPLRSG